MFMSGQEIYDNFTNARGPADMAGGADVVSEVVSAYNQRGDQIKKLLSKMDAVWKGDAAGAAHRGAGPLAVEHALAAPAMDTMRDLVSRQSGSFVDAKNSVIPVPPAPDKVDPLAAFLAPGDLVTYQQQLSRHNAATLHNVDVMRGYENASAYNMKMPDTYGSITADQAEIRIAQATPPPSGPGDNPNQPGQGTGGPRPPADGGGGTGSGGGQPGSTGSGSGPGTGGQGSGGPGSGGPGSGGVVVPPPLGTTPGGFTPPAPGPGVGVPNVPVGAGNGPGTGGPGLGFAGTGIGPVGIPSEGTGSGGRGGAPGAGSGSGVGGRGPGGAGGLGAGGRTGAGPLAGPVTAESAGARGTPTGRGGPGGMPMGAGPGGRGRGGEDEEHQRASFLEEPDPEAIFGTGERTPPPVIGG